MSWHDDRQRKKDTEERRQVRAQELETRQRAARRVYEAGGTIDEAGKIGKAATDTVKRWIREGGWKRDQS